MAESHIHALPAGFELEGYRIERMLGSGGFGITYKATETLIRRSVAIKEYLPSSVAAREVNSSSVRPLGEADAELFRWGLKRFRNEARTLVAFHHPNIVSVYRFFEANGTAYLVMAFEEGMSLAAILKQAKTLPEHEIHEFLDPLLGGVAEVHKAGFLHRDIKPANIMIRRDGTPSLIDFGAARLALGGKTESASKAVVSPGYAPFEQYSSTLEQGPYTDIYALGATLYSCIAGERPPEALDRVAGQSMPSALNTGRGNYSEGLLRAVDHALALKPEDRPQTVAAWREELGAATAGAHEDRASSTASTAFVETPTERDVATQPEPTVPQPTVSAPTAAPPRRRRRLLKLAVVAVLVLAGSAGAYAGVDYYLKLERQRAAEEQERRKQEEERQRKEKERLEKERIEAEKRKPAEESAAKAREAQKRAQAAQRLAVSAREQAFVQAECGRKAAERARNRDAGYSTIRYTSNAVYEGKVSDRNTAEGCGVLVEPGNRRFEGQFSDTPHGYAVYAGPDGLRYEGGYQKGSPHGSGVMRFNNGEETSGDLREGRFEGTAVWTSPSGHRFEGEHRNGQWMGYGVLTENDGRVFEGQFTNGKLNGLAIFTDKDGKKTYGRWENGSYKGLQ